MADTEIDLSSFGVRLSLLEKAERRIQVELVQKQQAVEAAVATLKMAVVELHELRDLQSNVKRELRILRLATETGDNDVD